MPRPTPPRPKWRSRRRAPPFRMGAHDAAGAARHPSARLHRDPGAPRGTRPAARTGGRQDAPGGDWRSDAGWPDLRLLRRRSAQDHGDKFASIRPGIDIEATREPVGVVGIISPWNFPIAIPAWKIAPALAYGNAVVFKPADLVPGCAHALAEIIVRAGVPKGVFNLVMGRGSVVGQAMLDARAWTR